MRGLLFVSLLAGCESVQPAPTPTPGDKLYVANEEDGTISVIDEESLTVQATIDLSDGPRMFMPHNVQVSPDGRGVWVTAPPMSHVGDPAALTDELVIIDPTRDLVASRVTLGSKQHPAHVVFDARSRDAFVTATVANVIIHLDVATHAILERHALGEGTQPHGLRVCGGRLFIADMGARALTILDPTSGAREDVPLDGLAMQTGCTPDGRYAFVSLYDTREVIRYDLTSRELVRIALPPRAMGPVQLYPSPDSRRLYVCDQGMLILRPASKLLIVIDVERAEVEGTVEVGQGAHGVVVNPDGSRAFVTNLAEATVSVVDTEALSVLATIPVGHKPNGISHWSADSGMP